MAGRRGQHHEEHPHFARHDGRAVEDYVRFDQLGTASGWVVVGDDRVDVDGWFAWRDHSWGVRPGMGGADPVVPQPSTEGPSRRVRGSIFVWMAFRAGAAAGQFQVVETAAGREHVDGHLIPDVSRPGQWLRTAIEQALRLLHDRGHPGAGLGARLPRAGGRQESEIHGPLTARPRF